MSDNFEKIFFFAIVFSVGMLVDGDTNRSKFSTFIIDAMVEKDINTPTISSTGTI